MNAEETGKYLEVVQQYGKFFADIYFHPIIFIVLVLILVSVYVIEYILIFNEDKGEAIKKNVLKEFKIYVIAHMLLQLLICFLIAYLVIKFCNALIDSYIINWILAPTIGLIISIIVDARIIVPLEDKSGAFRNPIKEKNEEKDINESSNSIAQNNITINVGSKNTTKEMEERIEPMESTININETNDDIIRTLINVQEEQGRQLQILMGIVDNIREDIVTNRRFELRDSMMECVIRGYATADEYERISEKMKTYIALKGNHINELYEKKFLPLPIK